MNELIDIVQCTNLPSEWAIFQVKITWRCGMKAVGYAFVNVCYLYRRAVFILFLIKNVDDKCHLTVYRIHSTYFTKSTFKYFYFFLGGQTQFPEGLQGNKVHLIFCKILRGSIPVGTAMKLLMYINQSYPLVRIVF
jgi:hypothetical protein